MITLIFSSLQNVSIVIFRTYFLRHYYLAKKKIVCFRCHLPTPLRAFQSRFWRSLVTREKCRICLLTLWSFKFFLLIVSSQPLTAHTVTPAPQSMVCDGIRYLDTKEKSPIYY